MLTLGLALALFAQDAPAPPVKEPVYYSLSLPNLEGAKDDKGQHLKIASFTWGGGASAGAPPSPGSVNVKTEYPWTGCKVGASYPSLSLSGGGTRYQVEEVTVSKCSSDSAVFDYKKVTASTSEAAKKE